MLIVSSTELVNMIVENNVDVFVLKRVLKRFEFWVDVNTCNCEFLYSLFSCSIFYYTFKILINVPNLLYTRTIVGLIKVFIGSIE